MNQKRVVVMYTILSSSAAVIVFTIAVIGSSNGQLLSTIDRLVIGSALMASFVLGIVSNAKLVQFKRVNSPGSRVDNGYGCQRRRIGHHPDCDKFKDHTMVIGGRVRCSGCFGLELGCVIGLLLLFLVLIDPIIVPSQGPALVIIGLLLVLTNFAETAHHSRTPALHIIFNVILPIGFLSVTIGVSEATGDVAVGLLAVLISFLLLETRIHISDWKHMEICRMCGKICQSY